MFDLILLVFFSHCYKCFFSLLSVFFLIFISVFCYSCHCFSFSHCSQCLIVFVDVSLTVFLIAVCLIVVCVVVFLLLSVLLLFSSPL